MPEAKYLNVAGFTGHQCVARSCSQLLVRGNMNFGSDNAYGVHPNILDAINDANSSLTATAYGHDEGSLKVEKERRALLRMAWK